MGIKLSHPAILGGSKNKIEKARADKAQIMRAECPLK
jgi:hypothetical protein